VRSFGPEGTAVDSTQCSGSRVSNYLIKSNLNDYTATTNKIEKEASKINIEIKSYGLTLYPKARILFITSCHSVGE